MPPSENTFFRLIGGHADEIVRGAEELPKMLNGGEGVRKHYPAVVAAEDAADVVPREVIQAVRRTFVTLFDRGSIQTLISRVENDADDIHETGMIDLYRHYPRDGVLRFLAAREVLDQLERTVDWLDDAANEIEGIVVEHV